MLNTIFTKLLYERRWSTFAWFVGITFFTCMLVLFFPTVRDSLGASLKDVPPALQKLVGSASNYQTLTGFIDIKIIGQMVFFAIIEGVILGSALLAGAENSGTLQMLLVQPVSRTKVYLHHYLAMVVILFCTVVGGITIAALLGEVIIHVSAPFDRLLQASLMSWLLTVFFSTLAFSTGAIFGNRGLAGGAVGAFAFISFIITSLITTAQSLKSLDYISPFHYFNNPSIMKNGLDFTNIAILAAATVIIFVVGLFVFRKRDIYQR